MSGSAPTEIPSASPLPGPGADATTTVAAVETTAAPSDFPSASEAPAVEVPVAAVEAQESAPAETGSILSEAVGDAPTETKADDAAVAPIDPVAAEPAAAPTYEPFKLPEAVQIDDAVLGTFSGMLGEFESRVAADPAQAHAIAQEFGQQMLDLYATQAVEAGQKMQQMQVENWNRTQEQWQGDFRNDPEIGGNRQQTTLRRMGAMMDLYGQSAGPERLKAVQDIFTMTGAGNHTEVLRFVNWAATRLTETSRAVIPVAARAPVLTSKAQRLYRNSTGTE